MMLDTTAFVGEEALVKVLRERSTPLDCGDGRVLFRQDDSPDGLYIVHDECVNLSMRLPGGELVMDIPAQPGSLLGLPGCVSGIGYSLSATARKGAQVSFVSREEFSRMMLQDPSIAMMILKVLATEVRTARIAAANLKARESHALHRQE